MAKTTGMGAVAKIDGGLEDQIRRIEEYQAQFLSRARELNEMIGKLADALGK